MSGLHGAGDGHTGTRPGDGRRPKTVQKLAGLRREVLVRDGQAVEHADRLAGGKGAVRLPGLRAGELVAQRDDRVDPGRRRPLGGRSGTGGQAPPDPGDPRL